MGRDIQSRDTHDRWTFWIDRGGTFTDFVAVSDRGEVQTFKILSQTETYRDAILTGIAGFFNQTAEQVLPLERIREVRIGTTIATNALLEGRGADFSVFITQGLEDLFLIGDQSRPETFALKIRRPQPLYRSIHSVRERLSAMGEAIQALDESQLIEDLELVRDQKIDTIAFVFLHADRFPAHELRAAEIAKKLGFRRIYLSHQVSPTLRILQRGETTCLQAYLEPVLHEYIADLREKLGRVPLLFMQSHGGLTPSEQFHAKDSLLSGPAGGLVGAVATAAEEGLSPIVTFDMGGTSTDVAYFDGSYHISMDQEIAGRRIRVPMLDIHTVAAGGGSMLFLEDGRLRVGPESAGALPGPLCYGRNGHLALTDVNLVLQRLLPESFQNSFGAHSDRPVSVTLAREGLERLLPKTSFSSVEDLALGFLHVAIDNMAAAIRRVSIEKGRDLGGVTLQCFGGAGAQVVCRLAESLGIEQIIIHPFAGVLSALGIGLAERKQLREKTVRRLWSSAEDFVPDFESLESHQKSELSPDSTIQWRRYFHFTFEGMGDSIRVEWVPNRDPLNDFRDEFQNRFGYQASGAVLIESVSVEAVQSATQIGVPRFSHSSEKGELPSTLPFFLGANLKTKAQVYRESSAPSEIEGPALIIGPHSTMVVEPGWRAERRSTGAWLLRWQQVRAVRNPSVKQADPAWLEIFANRYMSIAEQMGGALRRTATSVNIRERLDFSCALFDSQGQLLANAPHIPVHLGSMQSSVQALIRGKGSEMQSGDVYASNSPYNGGTHLPDITVITPVFHQDQIRFYVASRGHHSDIGGVTPGSMPATSRHIEEEGILLDQVRIVHADRFNEEGLLRLLSQKPFPARNPNGNLADLRAQVAANHLGEQLLLRLIEEFQPEVVEKYIGWIFEWSERAVRRRLQSLKGGRASMKFDDGGEVSVNIVIDSASGEARIDFTGTCAQKPNCFNAPRAITLAATSYVLRTLLSESLPLNAGALRPIELQVPHPSVLSPEWPGAVVAGNVETSQLVTDALLAAFGVLAASQGTMNNLSFGNDRHQYYETICGGTGAGPGFDGADAVQSHMTNSRLTDPEVLETRFPIQLVHFGIRRGSGGRGKYRGGDGCVRALKFLEPMQVNLLSGRRTVAPPGMKGGGDGLPGLGRCLRADGSEERLEGCAQLHVDAGDVIWIETPGGGGFEV